MDVVAIVGGAALVLTVFVDAFMTTLTMSWGPGPLSSRFLGALWRVLLALHRRRGSAWLSMAGGLLLVTTVLVWVALLWVGWSLVLGGSGDLADARTGQPAGVADVAYYAGYTLFTLGTGDVVPGNDTARLLSVLATFTGLFLVTLAITYLVAVVSAVVRRRSLAIRIHGLGGDPGQIVLGGWRHGGFTAAFEQQLIALTPDVVLGAEQHLAYPVLHYFHPRERSLATSQAIASLDEAVLLMTAVVRPPHRPDPSVTEPLRHAIGRYLSTVHEVAWSPQAQTPPAPSVDRLAEAGVPVVAEAELRAVLEREASRRRRLNRLLRSDGWTWPGR